MLIKGFSCFSSGSHFRGSSKEHFNETILKLGHWPTSKYHLKVFLSLALVANLCSRVDHFSIFGRGSPKKHFCEII